VTSVPEIARIEDWKGQGPVLGRAEAARRLEEAHKLFEEIRRHADPHAAGDPGRRATIKHFRLETASICSHLLVERTLLCD
jgi:hypothetical protein